MALTITSKPMGAKILWLESALEDLEAVANRRELSMILHKVEMLADFPYLGSAMHGEWEGFRRTLAGNYWIVYCLLPSDQVGIAYIRHTRRRFPYRPSSVLNSD